MSWLLRHNWLWSLLAFVLGAIITWILLDRRRPAAAPPPLEEPEPVLVGAAVTETKASAPEPVFSRVMDTEPGSRVMDAPTLFDVEPAVPQPAPPAKVAPGRYGEGSAEAVPHQGPPDGFTIKGNAQSMLFHTPDSPYYGRTKPEVWFRTEADAERAGFAKYVRRPRKSTNPATDPD
ncbi:sunset domain-containing protein [Kribbella kalugense]|uniref:Membrane protein ArfC n=1 Tax=Kribbella kalugense TaxID=2512221 RepID=A0A4R7ZGU7_9ACTN|nr:hypothetical protein [Kribbella kalugense]TDW14220.1 hypothetical protein EV650_7803 [Kribbella kalugense]